MRIAEIVSPLRYDVTIRVRHYVFHAKHRELFAGDFEAYQRLAREQEYFVWFKRSEVPDWVPEAVDDADELERAWRERLRESAALYDSFQERGFDAAQPIELWAGHRIRETPTGKRTSRGLFAGDGNHRLSVLMAAGHDTLLPAQYRIRRFLSLAPFDTTGYLLRETGAGWPEYREFIELGYPTVRLTLDGGRVRIDAADPALRSEVKALVEHDLPNLAGMTGYVADE